MNKSKLIKFYSGEGTDHKGRTIEDMLNFPDSEFDECHDFIQWMFPLHEASRMTSADVPIFTREDFQAFHAEKEHHNVERAARRFVKFLRDKSPENWCNDGDHNLLRITRVIRSLRLMNHTYLAKALYEMVIACALKRKISNTTISYWHRAYNEPVFDTLY